MYFCIRLARTPSIYIYIYIYIAYISGQQNTCPYVGGLPDIHVWTRILLIQFTNCIGTPGGWHLEGRNILVYVCKSLSKVVLAYIVH